MMWGQYYFNWNLCSLSVCSCTCEDSRVPPLNHYWDIFIAEDLHCLKAVDRNFVRNGGKTWTHCSCSWAGVSEQSLTICSSDFVFRKYKQDSAFRVSGVLQLAKTRPLAMKNFPLLCLFPSDMMTSEGFTHLMTSTILMYIFWLRAECRTFWLELANFEAREKIRMR